jgi:enamine deaminase RidA (YjgF/YER057c/UK114 family)
MNRIVALTKQLVARPSSGEIVRKHLSNPNMSQSVEHSDVVYLAGQVGTDFTSSVADQTAQTLEKIDALLADSGLDKTRLLTANVFFDLLVNLVCPPLTHPLPTRYTSPT